MGRVFTGNASTAAGGSSGGRTATAPSGSRINWSQAAGRVTGPPPPSPLEQKVISSFMSLDSNSRRSSLYRLTQAAQKGDTGARRKLDLLLPRLNSSLPKEQDFTDNSLSGKAFRLSGELARTLINPFVGGTAGEENVQRNAAGRVTNFDAGRAVGLRDQAIKGIEARLMLSGGKGVVEAGRGLKGVASAGLRAGAANAAASTVANSTSDNIDRVAGTSFGDTIANIGKEAGGAFAAGAALGAGSKTAGKVIAGVSRRVAQYLDDPVSQVAATRVEARTPDLSDKDFRAAVKKEIKSINTDKTQRAAIFDAYKRGGLGEVSKTNIRPGHQIDIEKAAAAGDYDKVGQIIDSMPDGDPYKESMRSLFADRLPKRTSVAPKVSNMVSLEQQARAGNKTAAQMLAEDLQGSANRVAPAGNKPVAQDVVETLSTPGASSRVKQYGESLRKTISNLEKDPTYQAELAAKGGGEVITNRETYARAVAAGPLDEQIIRGAQAGEPVDSVTLVRAKATLDAAAKDFTDFWKSKKWTPEELQQRIQDLSELESGYHVMSAEPGRATQIQGSFIDEAFKRAQKLKQLLEQTKGPNRNEIIERELAAFDEQMAAGEKSGLFTKETFERLQGMIAEYATAAKLTSPLTHAVNIISSLINAPVRGAENLITTSWGAARGETTLKSMKYIFGSSQGIRRASEQFASDLRQTFDINAPDIVGGAKLEVPSGAIPGRAGKIVRTPFNLLTSADNFFKNVLRDSEYHQRAFEQAYQEGFRKAALAKRVTELVENPTEAMRARAEKVAAEFTFTTEPGPLASGVSKILQKVPLMRLLIPFVQTPTNIVKFQAQRHPIGVFSPRNIKDVMAGGLERREAVARIAVGSLMTAGAIEAAFNAGHNITGAAPSGAGEKDSFYASGKKPYSIKIGNQWVSYNRFQPLGLYLTQAVGIRDALASGDSKTAGNLFTTLVVTTAKGVADLPFVSGVSGVISALNDPTNESYVSRAFGGILTGLIPNVSRNVASAADPLQRNARTISDQIKMMVPGLRNTVKPRTTVTGENQLNGGSPLQRGFLNIVTEDKGSDLSKALDEIGRETGYYPSQPKPGVKVQGRKLSTQEYERYAKLSGQKFASKLQVALSDAAFKELDPADKQRTLESMVSDSRKQAAEQLFGKVAKKKSSKIKRY